MFWKSKLKKLLENGRYTRNVFVTIVTINWNVSVEGFDVMKNNKIIDEKGFF